MSKRVLLYAPVKTRSGYGDHARDIARSIISYSDYKLEIFPTNWGNTSWNGLDTTTEVGMAIESCITKRPTPNPDIFIQLTIPNEFIRLGKYNIGMTAGIETDLCKPEWVEGANNMDMVIGVSEHSISVLKNSKYDKQDKTTNQIIGSVALKESLKTEVLFEGIDTEMFKKTSKIDQEVKDKLSIIKEDFCFLFVGHWLEGDLGQDRKDVGMLVKTFCEAFKNKPSRTRPALILKTSGSGFSVSDRYEINKKIQAIRDTVDNCPSVYLIHGQLSDYQMNSLYNHHKVKAMVSFTKGEGFGRPLLEFTATGKPVIASGWSGPMDFLNPDMSYLLPGDLLQVHKSVVNKWFMAEAKWFTVNYAFAIKVLQSIEKNYSEVLKRSEEQRKYTLSNFTFDKMSNKLYNILDSIPVTKEVPLTLPKLKKI